MVYQGLLLSERKRLRTESIEEHITPNSAPAQWPGKKRPCFFSSTVIGGVEIEIETLCFAVWCWLFISEFVVIMRSDSQNAQKEEKLTFL